MKLNSLKAEKFKSFVTPENRTGFITYHTLTQHPLPNDEGNSSNVVSKSQQLVCGVDVIVLTPLRHAAVMAETARGREGEGGLQPGSAFRLASP